MAYLGFYRVPALFTEIHKVQNTTFQMSQGGDALHLNRVHVFERVIQDTRSIDYLPSEVFIVKVANE